jgi:hypothetical protein
MSNEQISSPSRRFVLKAAVGVGGLAVGGATIPIASLVVAAAPVVSLHMDRPYLDLTGQAWAFAPAAGTRSAAVLADLTEEQHRWLQPFG